MIVSAHKRLGIIKKAATGKTKIASICRQAGISRKTFYKWQKRYNNSMPGSMLASVSNKKRESATREFYPRQASEEQIKAILSIVLAHPDYSAQKIASFLPLVKGKSWLGNHGVQNVLKRLNLSHYEQRLAYTKLQIPAAVIKPVASWIDRLRTVFSVFSPIQAAAPPFGLSRFFKTFSFSFFLSLSAAVILGLWLRLFNQTPQENKIGIIFASLALISGTIFFLYSLKYYITLALVLGFSRHIEGENGEENGKNTNGEKSWLSKFFGIDTNANNKGYTGGLQPNLDQIVLTSKPFVSIHLAMYNEKKVVNRLLTACTSFDYENYEVVVVDDSTDETTEILKDWKNHPRVRVIHRESREGFKGGALKAALQKSDPRTEFVLVFDADFVPYPDTITQFLKYFKATTGTLDFKTNTQAQESKIAAIQGYQWHVLNKSENWITRGVRSEYAGSYVVERSGTEVYGGMKQIAGSVYMIRKDILEKFGWKTSITEDFQLTLRLYEAGYKVVYTPYIQAPSECVSTIKRLVRQRMRWAEGHSFNVKKMAVRLFISPEVTVMEKLEFAYLSPYYLQAAFFILGTLSWFISETVFKARLPFWTSLWGWSLVLTNMFALPLTNTVGLFLEESEEKDYLGILSFVTLSYLLVPFQAYASIKGFLEKEEGPWFRTPKTGIVTDVLTRGRFYRWLSGILPGFKPMAGGIASQRLAPAQGFLKTNPYLAYASSHNVFNQFKVQPKRIKGLANFVVVGLLLASLALSYFSLPLNPIQAYDGTYYFRNTEADNLASTGSAPRKKMSTGSLGSTTQSVAMANAPGTAAYAYFHDSNGAVLNAQAVEATSSAALADTTMYGSQNHLFRDKWGNLIFIYINTNADIKAMYKNYNNTNGVWDIYNPDLYAGTVTNVSGALDTANGNLHLVWEETATTVNIYYRRIVISRDANGLIQSSGWTVNESVVTLQSGATGDAQRRPTILIDQNDLPLVAWSRSNTTASKNAGFRFTHCCVNTSACSISTDNWEATGTSSTCDTTPTAGVNIATVAETSKYSEFHTALAQMPSTNSLYAFPVYVAGTTLYYSKATVKGTKDYNDFTINTNWVSLDAAVGTDTTAAPFSLAVARDEINNKLVFAWARNVSKAVPNGTVVETLDSSDTLAEISLVTEPYWGSAFSIYTSGNNATNMTYYLFHTSAAAGGTVDYHTYSNSTWLGSISLEPNGTNTYPSVRAEDQGAANDLGGRLDVIYYQATNKIKYKQIILDKTADSSQGSTARTQKVGYNGFDYLYFATATVSASTKLSNYGESWKVKVCVTSGYLANTHLKVKWQLIESDNITVGEESTEQTWSSVSAGAQCDDSSNTLAFTAPSSHTDLQNHRVVVRVAYDNDGTDSIPVIYDGNTVGTNDMKLTYYTYNDPITTFYILTDNMNKVWTGGDKELPTEGTTSEQRNVDMATDSTGNTYAVWEDERNSQSLGTWSVTGTSTYSHGKTNPVLLDNGKVLIVGDWNSGTSGRTIAELYDPATGQWSLAGTTRYSRGQGANLIKLTNGKVLAIGGVISGLYGTSIAEIYDPNTNTWSLAGTSNHTRYLSAGVLLNNGKVLEVGGGNQAGESMAEIYDPELNTWTVIGTIQANDSNRLTILPNGKVLTLGTDTGTATTIAEMYDPITNTWSITGTTTYHHNAYSSTLLKNGKVFLAGAKYNKGNGRSIAEMYDPETGTWSITGTSNYAHGYIMAGVLNNDKLLILGDETTSGSGTTIAELYDPFSNSWSLAGTAYYSRQESYPVVLNNGKVLYIGSTAGSGLTIAELYTPKTADIYAQKFDKGGTAQWNSGADIRINSDDGNRSTNGPNYDHLSPKIKLDLSNNPIITWQQATNSVYGDDIYAQKLLGTTGAKQWPTTSTGTWAVTGTMNYVRYNHNATLLADGKVLLSGGGASGQTIAELFNPFTEVFSITGTSTYGRNSNAATLLNNGKVLLSGTETTNSPGMSISELYDLSAGTWSITGTMTYGRGNNIATLLNNGKVLVSGTDLGNSGSSIAELYDPSTGSWSVTGTSSYAHNSHNTTLLNNGKVLLSDTLANEEIYDPVAGTWSTTGNNTKGSMTANLLNNGKVLGVGNGSGDGLTIAELYDPSTGTWSDTGTTTYSRNYHTATLLGNGKVLVTGVSNNNGNTIAELYDPTNGTWSITGTSNYGHYNHTSTLLNNGKVLVTGNFGSTPSQTIAELYTPSGDIPVSNDGSPTNGYGLPTPEHPGMKGILGEQRNPVLAIDSSDNPVIAWEDTRYNAVKNWGLSFNYDANAYWQTERNVAGVGKCNGGGGTNNSCGVIQTINSSPLRIMGQKLLGTTGAKQWGNTVNANNPEDLGLASTGDYSSKPSLMADGTNIIASWQSNGAVSSGNSDAKEYNIYSQKFNSSGIGQWGGTWEIKGTTTYDRSYHAATLLNNGKVLVVGTANSNGGITIAELYNPSVGTWSVTGTSTYTHYYTPVTLLTNGKVLAAGSSGSAAGQTITELYDPATGTWAITGTMNYARSYHTATLLNNGKVLAAGSWTGSAGQTIAELYDPSVGTWSVTGTTTYARSSLNATLLNNGKVLVVGTDISNSGQTIAELYDPATGTWAITGTMNYARYWCSTVLLSNGKVLTAGSYSTTGSGATIAELYDPSAGTFSVTGTLTYSREYHTATLLNNGKVLVAGTENSNSGQTIAELYDPSIGTWSVTGTANYANSRHTATLLNNGKVLKIKSVNSELYSVDQMVNTGSDLADQRNPVLAKDSGNNYIYAWQGRRGGGTGGGSYTASDSDRSGGSWKIYGMKTNSSGTSQWPTGTSNTWSVTGTTRYQRYNHGATVLNNGKVLVHGYGTTSLGSGSTIAELYDPSAGTWSVGGTSTYGRSQATTTLLPNNKVLIIGARAVNSGRTIAELFDPSTGTWSITGTCNYERFDNTATLLNNGKVLVLGGNTNYPSGTIAELYDPSAGTWAITGTVNNVHVAHTATLLNNGNVLIAGGSTVPYTPTDIYNTSGGTFSTTGALNYGRYGYSANLLNNGKVLAVGSYDNNAGRSIAELYDPVLGTWSVTGTTTYIHSLNTGILLNNGKVLVVGDALGGSGGSIAELYDPSTGIWSVAGTVNYLYDSHTASLLNNGKILIIGSYNVNVPTSAATIAELYTPAGELALSHDPAQAGDQENPSLYVSGTDIYAAWDDNRNASASASFTRVSGGGDRNIFMQKFDTNGAMQWPAAATTGFTSPYSVSDVRVDTYAGQTGTHYSGKPVIGGLYNDSSGTAPLVIGWNDNRNSSTDPMDIYAQSYDTREYDVNQTSPTWTVHLDNGGGTASVDVNVGIVESDGATYAAEGGLATAQTLTNPIAGESDFSWTTTGTPASKVGNVSMRRLIVTLTKSSGTLTFYFDNGGAAYDSRLEVGTVVPEKTISLGIIMPFLPPMVSWYARRKRKEAGEDEAESRTVN